jgi:hypothetical protein
LQAILEDNTKLVMKKFSEGQEIYKLKLLGVKVKDLALDLFDLAVVGLR